MKRVLRKLTKKRLLRVNMFFHTTNGLASLKNEQARILFDDSSDESSSIFVFTPGKCGMCVPPGWGCKEKTGKQGRLVRTWYSPRLGRAFQSFLKVRRFMRLIVEENGDEEAAWLKLKNATRVVHV